MTDKMAANMRQTAPPIWTRSIHLIFCLFLVPSAVVCGLTGTKIDTVHIIFMNHLDVGYNGIPKTGFINNIVNIYFHEYFPRAIQLAKTLRNEKYMETFIYTTHPWLVSLYLDCPHMVLNNIPLQCPNSTDVAAFKKAVEFGDIVWHAGPMNMQPENMNKILFEMGLNISMDLDFKFGIKRQYATLSQRDVPGMTAAVIPSLVKYGIRAVSVGVNPGTSPPAVPSPSVWSYNNKEVIALWHKGGYPLNPGPYPSKPGGISRDDCVIVNGFNQALCFAFRTDNSGPPLNITEILNNYEILRSEFPGAALKASTFDNYIEALQSVRSQLPVVYGEVGDTWIQGISSDPLKMAKYWAFANQLQECVDSGQCSGDDPRIKAAVRFLIKPPEHTWGLPSVGDNVNWTNTNFQKAKTGIRYKNCTAAWMEQRQFIDMALSSLQDHVLGFQVKQEWEKQRPEKPDLRGYKLLTNRSEPITCDDGIVLQFGEDGSLVELYDPYNKLHWASPTQQLGQVQYFTYNETDFTFMASLYDYFGGAGFDKPNATQYAKPLSKQWKFLLAALYKHTDSANKCDLLLHILPADPKMVNYYGAPQELWLQYITRPQQSGRYPGGVDVAVQLFDKTPTRLAESISYGFNPIPSSLHQWYISKISSLIDAGSVLLNGSQYLHATDSGVYYISSVDGSGLQILSSDVPLVYVGTRSHPPSPFPVPLKPISQSEITGMAFNLHNNIWNTNYILWYPYQDSTDAHFKGRFKINLHKAQSHY